MPLVWLLEIDCTVGDDLLPLGGDFRSDENFGKLELVELIGDETVRWEVFLSVSRIRFRDACVGVVKRARKLDLLGLLLDIVSVASVLLLGLCDLPSELTLGNLRSDCE